MLVQAQSIGTSSAGCRTGDDDRPFSESCGQVFSRAARTVCPLWRDAIVGDRRMDRNKAVKRMSTRMPFAVGSGRKVGGVTVEGVAGNGTT